MSAFDQVWKSVTVVPTNDLTTKQYTFVTYDSNGGGVTPAAGAPCAGVLYEPNKAGQPAQAVAQGFAFVTFGATVAPGQAVMTDANGNAVPYAVGTAPAFNVKLGICVVGGASGAIGTVQLQL